MDTNERNDMENRIEVNWEAATEVAALFILGMIATVAMFKLGIGGKEIALAIGSGIGGYLVKGKVNEKKVNKEPVKNEISQ